MKREHDEKEKAYLEEILPTISRHRCSPSPRRSPVSIEKSISKQEQDSQSSPTFVEAVDLPSLIPFAVNETFNIILEEDKDMLARSQDEDGSDSLSSDDGQDIGKYGYGDSASREQQQEEEQHSDSDEEEDYAKYGYGETETATTTIFIDNEDDDEESEDDADKYGYGEESEDDAGKYGYGEESEDDADKYGYGDTSGPSPPSDNKAFCPNRIPRRSSMKGSVHSGGAEALPMSFSRRASIGGSPQEEYEVLLPGQRTPVQRRRSIAFDKEVNVQKVEPVKFLATNGPQSLWFQENEYETIKIKTLALLDRIDHSSGDVDGKKYCTRGLEKFMTPEATEVKKHQAWDSVLNEQYLQRKDGEFDEETLANIYRYSTKRSQSEASQRANVDAEHAEAYLETTFRRQSSLDDWKARTSGNRRQSM